MSGVEARFENPTVESVVFPLPLPPSSIGVVNDEDAKEFETLSPWIPIDPAPAAADTSTAVFVTVAVPLIPIPLAEPVTIEV